ncbi:stalk domain-containing protein [Mesobacillus harenae]|uniref:stalk domain-containing protein n=1 Tax=Mesobacillus harenae TaxID=2213203 RepID=UPI0015802F39|nr:stalk domain-containing protein [Mesobacillus harenae]
MRKMLFFIFPVLLSIFGLILIYQWQGFTQQSEGSSSFPDQAEQAITINAYSNKLKITQEIQGLSKMKEYKLLVPKSLSDFTCNTGEANPCKVNGLNPDTFLTDTGTFNLTYTILINKDSNSLFLPQWSVSFPGLSDSKTTLEMIDYDKGNGTWAAGIPVKGFKEEELINYYVFEGNNEDPALYWQSAPIINISVKQGISIFAPKLYEEKAASYDPTTVAGKWTIVFTESGFETVGGGMIVTGVNTKTEELNNKLVQTFISGRFTGQEDERLLWQDVMESLILDKESDSKKGQKMVEEIQRAITPSQFEELKKLILQETEKLTFRKADEILSAVLGKETRFLNMNSQQQEFVPLFFIDQRDIVINGNKADIEIIIYKDKLLFPLKTVLQNIGYKVTEFPEEREISIGSKGKEYLFYLDKNIFHLNNEKFGFFKSPFIEVNGLVYMETHALNSIFHLFITTEEKEIVIHE